MGSEIETFLRGLVDGEDDLHRSLQKAYEDIIGGWE